jgi:hypothetical protein
MLPSLGEASSQRGESHFGWTTFRGAGHKNTQHPYTAAQLRQQISFASAIQSRVIALLHDFITQTYYEKTFSGLAESIFEQHKTAVEKLLADTCEEVLEKVPAVYSRLAEGNQEAVSQALGTIRRIIDAFADAVYPPTDATAKIDANIIHLRPSHHLNRLNVYVRDHTTSDARRKKLRQALANLYERVSTGIHRDVSPTEARALFLEMYLLLGEILSL